MLKLAMSPNRLPFFAAAGGGASFAFSSADSGCQREGENGPQKQGEKPSGRRAYACGLFQRNSSLEGVQKLSLRVGYTTRVTNTNEETNRGRLDERFSGAAVAVDVLPPKFALCPVLLIFRPPDLAPAGGGGGGGGGGGAGPGGPGGPPSSPPDGSGIEESTSGDGVAEAEARARW